MSTLITIVGTVGAVVMLYGYAMVSAGRMSGDGTAFQVLNLAGAVTLMVNSGYHSAWPSAVLNMVWSGIGVFTLGRLVSRRAAARRAAAGPGPADGAAQETAQDTPGDTPGDTVRDTPGDTAREYGREPAPVG
ncbi:hypothetical protein JOL79_01935 [Microbispora sp. RL4-1S]|uniref:CBU-0592-like domain-containing protein n=1 Tax=Microbispora oryzae TaxID=2806554 RepID=A0A940WBR9_9ACTN|nr:hypothetical protein [Microbispora oryzae]MBP2702560.1 hypothetical protein [Microbispora oryzae]